MGRPNVGKSSLLNALLERERAIVTEVPGTTRDVIEEYLNIRGLPVRIMDTAGIREAHDMAEAEGVRRSLKALGEADLVIGVVDRSEPLHEQDREVIGHLPDSRALLVMNKADMPSRIAGEFELPVAEVSAKTGDGIEELRTLIYETATGKAAKKARENVVITNLRHRSALADALRSLEAARSALEEQPLEIAAMELREALDALGRIVGAVTTDDILERIFLEFCIGK